MRAGRVLHWISLALAGVLLLIVFNVSGDDALIVLAGAFLTSMFGRGLRYILSNE